MSRVLIETYAHKHLKKIAYACTPQGPGWDAVLTARDAGRPMVFFSGHFGNFHITRLALHPHDIFIGVLYREQSNPYLEKTHRKVTDHLGLSFPRSPKGINRMVRHLKSGGGIEIIGDQHVNDGEVLTFFNQPAATSVSAAKLALKFDALLIPIFASRRPDGLTFDVTVEAPVPHDTPEKMTQSLNDSLEAMIRKFPDQWLWSSRRWRVQTSK